MPKHITKIDKKGHYRKFPGISVVAAIKDEDTDLWKEVYDSIHKITKGYYAPLPHTSYHMTAVDLYTEAAVGHMRWKQFVRSNLSFFQSIHTSFQDQAITPMIQIETTKIAGVIQLLLRLPQEQDSTIHRIATKFNVDKQVPKVFHITLAYPFKSIESSQAKLMEELIKTDIEKIFAKYGNVITLEPPKLCYFNDMKAFIPWNGDKSPFEHSHAHHLHDFFKWFSTPTADPTKDPCCKL